MMTPEDTIFDQNIKRYNRIIPRLRRWVWKWFLCSWFHRRHKCWPIVWDSKSDYWHCERCHDCGETFDILLNGLDEKGRIINNG